MRTFEKTPTMKEIADAFCKEHGVNFAVLKARCRDADIEPMRVKLMHALYTQSNKSIGQVAAFMDRKYHAVWNAVNVYKKHLASQ